VYTTTYSSPIGLLTLASDDEGLRHIIFPKGGQRFDPPEHWQQDEQALLQVSSELDEYFAGARQTFSVRLSPKGTEFQSQVWQALLSVEYAQTCSYGDIARHIIVPCHRIVGSSGNLTGFAGGLETKAWLLAHERGEGQLFDFTNP